MPGRSGKWCAVIGCHNSSGKLQLLKKLECFTHKPLLWEDCPCLVPYGMHRFPGRVGDAAVRQQWIKNLNRKDFVPTKNSVVCGIHFVDGRPTKEHPYPVLHLGYEHHGVSCGRRPPKRRGLEASKVSATVELQVTQSDPQVNTEDMEEIIPPQKCDGGIQRPESKEHNYSSNKLMTDHSTQTDPAPPVSAYDLDDKDSKFSTGIDILQVMMKEEEVPPEQQERSFSVKQEEPAEAADIKEEQEEMWSSQEREQLQGSEEADSSTFRFDIVSVKIEEDDEEYQSSHLQQRQTKQTESEAEGEDCGGSGGAENLHSQPAAHDETSNLSESDTDDSSDWGETDEARKGSSPPQNKDGAVRGRNCNTVDTSVCSSECAPSSGQKKRQQEDKGTETGEKPFSCSVCGNTYLRKKNLRQHMLRHSSEKPFSCTVCGKGFIWRKEYLRHMTTHTEEKPFSCSVCGKAYPGKHNLQQHMLRHSVEKHFSCSVCEKSFPWKGELVAHMRIHAGEKPFSCSYCDMKFTHSSSLAKHEQAHAGKKPFPCSYCEAAFRYKKDMVVHERVHTGEKPFSCSVCGKTFANETNWKRHSRTHTGEKPVSCSVCGKTFAHKRNWTRHSRTHTGEKPFSCDTCGKRFALRQQVKKHKCPVESSSNSGNNMRSADAAEMIVEPSVTADYND